MSKQSYDCCDFTNAHTHCQSVTHSFIPIHPLAEFALFGKLLDLIATEEASTEASNASASSLELFSAHSVSTVSAARTTKMQTLEGISSADQDILDKKIAEWLSWDQVSDAIEFGISKRQGYLVLLFSTSQRGMKFRSWLTRSASLSWHLVF